MATVAERYKAATDYVHRAITVVESVHIGYAIDPVTGLVEWYAGRTKTAQSRGELDRIEARWQRATSDNMRVVVAREAELLADRVEESLPGAPQDRPRTNLFVGEIVRATPPTSYAAEVNAQARQELGDATNKVRAGAGVGKWLLAGATVALGWKALDVFRRHERRDQMRAASGERRRLNASLTRVANDSDEDS